MAPREVSRERQPARPGQVHVDENHVGGESLDEPGALFGRAADSDDSKVRGRLEQLGSALSDEDVILDYEDADKAPRDFGSPGGRARALRGSTERLSAFHAFTERDRRLKRVGPQLWSIP